MKTFEIKYNGAANTLKRALADNPVFVDADNSREAAEKFYRSFIGDDFYMDDDGTITDWNGDIVRAGDNDEIKYDGGSIYAREVREVASISGSWDLDGKTFFGTVSFESGDCITGYHSESDYDWCGHWNP